MSEAVDELRDLYQEVILDHGRRPRNCHAMTDATATAEGNNPMCGDRLTVYLKTGSDGCIEDVSFEGRGCAISMASASMMTEMLRGKSEAEAETLFAAFRRLITEGVSDEAGPDSEIDRLIVLSGVRQFPSRVKCATLAWHAFDAALHGRGETVTTE